MFYCLLNIFSIYAASAAAFCRVQHALLSELFSICTSTDICCQSFRLCYCLYFCKQKTAIRQKHQQSVFKTCFRTIFWYKNKSHSFTKQSRNILSLESNCSDLDFCCLQYRGKVFAVNLIGWVRFWLGTAICPLKACLQVWTLSRENGMHHIIRFT